MSQWWYLALVAGVAVARLVELRVARRHSTWARERGGVETGAGHYPVMVALHTSLLVGCVLEVFLADRPFLPWLGWPMVVLLVLAHALRWWCIRTLGPQWNTRIVVVPGMPVVTSGPYRRLRHPNYVAVVLEGIALPLIHTAWITAVVFGVANLVLLLRFRIPAEERALAELAAGPGAGPDGYRTAPR
jgi:methyltransferase